MELIGAFEDVDAEWDGLAEASGNPFGAHAWCAAWWERYGGDHELHVLRVHDAGGRLAAILPLYRADRGPLRLLRFIGHGAADEHGPLCAPADRPLADMALREAASGLGRGGLLIAERLAGGTGASLGGRVVRHESSPVLAIEGRTWDEWLATKSGNFRQQARRMERKLARDHSLVFRLTEDPATLDADLDTLFRLHDLRWSSEGGSAAFDDDRRAFHRAFARAALRDGRLRLWTAEVDGEPAAAWYGLRHAGGEWYYQLGRDPAWDRYKVGFVLLVHTIRSAFEDGMARYHFGLGGEEYKDRFASDDPGLDTVLVGPRWSAGAVAGGLSAVRRLPAGARRSLGRRAGR